jgi:fused signal recognition particle receptor
MELILILVIAALVVLVGGGLFLVSKRSSRGAPPLTREAGRPATRPPQGQPTATLDRPGAPTAENQAGQELADAEIADLEAAFAEGEAPEPEVGGGVAVEELVRPSFRDRLAKARGAFSGYFGSVRGRGKIDADTWDELEEALILADVGVGPTQDLLAALQARVKRESIKDPEVLLDALKVEIKARIGDADRSLRLADDARPSIWLFVGVNGVGKTTTIGKLAKREIDAGRRVVLAAGDTFRAAAAEQLELWAERAGAEIVRGQEGGDPASVVFDAVERAAARDADLVLADTAGRLHTKVNLMEELRKVRRVAEKGSGRVSEVLLVLDATTGQNGLTQARQFTEAVEVTGVVLTKLDGSAKGGIVLAIQQDLGIPVKLVGLGEGIGDLVEFDPDEFVDALFE